jgi:AsmA protein
VNLADLLKHMNGTLRLELVNGKLKPFPVRQQIHTALAFPQKEPLPEATVPDTTTDFTHLTGTAVIEDGILYNDDLTVTAEMMQINGAGDIDLVRRQADCRLNVSLPFDPALNPKIKAPESGDTIIVPYTISGPFSGLTQGADVTRLLPPESETPPPQETPIATESKEPNPENSSSAPIPESVEKEERGD